jgi:WD40 repeat protein
MFESDQSKPLPDDAPLEKVLLSMVNSVADLAYYRQCIERYGEEDARLMLLDRKGRGIGSQLLSTEVVQLRETPASPTPGPYLSPGSSGQQKGAPYEATLDEQLRQFGEGGEDYFQHLSAIQSAFHDKSDCGRYSGMRDSYFTEFIAPFLTNSFDAAANQTLVCQLDADANGFVTFDDFSSYFLLRKRTRTLEPVVYDILSAPDSGSHHHSMISKVLFANSKPYSPSINSSIDRFCFTGGYDGSVHVWDTSNYMDHVRRIHHLPEAMKHRQWINDMCFSPSGKLCIAQSYGALYMYNVHAQSSSLHRIFRAGNADAADLAAVKLQGMALGDEIRRRNLVPEDVECILKGVEGDITSVTGPQHRLGGGALSLNSPGAGTTSNSAPNEPLLFGTDSGKVYLFNVWRPVDLVSHIVPIVTWEHFGKNGSIWKVLDDAYDNVVATVGCTAEGEYGIQFVDYEKGVPSIKLAAPRTLRGRSAVLTDIDYDAKQGVLVARGPSRQAVMFTTAFPEPITTLSHSGDAPVIGAMLDLSRNSIYTVTEDKTFHLWDARMWKKIQSVPDREQRWPENRYTAAAFDHASGSAFAASNVPLCLRDSTKNHSNGRPESPSTGNRAASGAQGRRSTLLNNLLKSGKPKSRTLGITAIASNPSLMLVHAVVKEQLRTWKVDDTFGLGISGGALEGTGFKECESSLGVIEVGTAVRISTDLSGRRLCIMHESGTELSLRSATSGEELSYFSLQSAPQSTTTSGTGHPKGKKRSELATSDTDQKGTSTSTTCRDEICCETFASTNGNSFLLLGTQSGRLHLLKDESLKLVLKETHLIDSSSILVMLQVPNCPKVLIGCANGHVYQYHLEQSITSLVLSGNTVTQGHLDGKGGVRLVRSPSCDSSGDRATSPAVASTPLLVGDESYLQTLSGNPPVAVPQTVRDPHVTRSLSLFQRSAVQSMNAAVEDIVYLDMGYCGILLGSGVLAVVHMTRTETEVAFSFPLCAASGSALGYHASGIIAAADFGGQVYFLSIQEYFSCMKVGRPLPIADLGGMPYTNSLNGVELLRVISLLDDTLITSLKGLPEVNEFIAVSSESRFAFTFSLTGELLRRFDSSRLIRQPSVIFSAVQLKGGRLEESHPFRDGEDDWKSQLFLVFATGEARKEMHRRSTPPQITPRVLALSTATIGGAKEFISPPPAAVLEKGDSPRILAMQSAPFSAPAPPPPVAIHSPVASGPDPSSFAATPKSPIEADLALTSGGDAIPKKKPNIPHFSLYHGVHSALISATPRPRSSRLYRIASGLSSAEESNRPSSARVEKRLHNVDPVDGKAGTSGSGAETVLVTPWPPVKVDRRAKLATEVSQEKALEDDDGTTKMKFRKHIPRLTVKTPDQPVTVGGITYKHPVPAVVNTTNRNLDLAIPPQLMNPIPRADTPEFALPTPPASTVQHIEQKIQHAMEQSASIAVRIHSTLRQRRLTARMSTSNSGAQVFKALQTRPVASMKALQDRVVQVTRQTAPRPPPTRQQAGRPQARTQSLTFSTADELKRNSVS